MKEDGKEFEEQFDEEPESGRPEPSSDDVLDDMLTSEIENRRPMPIEEKEVEVVGVYEHHEQGMPPGCAPPSFVLLRDREDRQVLIWVGRAEAYAISAALESVSFDRPMTHDLLKNVFDRLGGRVDRILIDDLWQDTYYAKITVATNGDVFDIDSRPSDAIALALRAKAPIFMAETVLQSAAISEETGE